MDIPFVGPGRVYATADVSSIAGVFLFHRKLRSVCNKKNSGGTHCGGKEDAACDSPPQAEIALSRNLSCTLAVNKATGFCVAAQPPVP